MQTMLKQIRRDLHQIPELDHDVTKTMQYIKQHLSKYRCVILHPTPSSIIAYFDFQQVNTYAFRSDMDALAIQEENNVPYASKHDGCMHACGHDGHMAMLLGFAHSVNALTQAPHNVLLVFQPAEETTGGAYDIVQSGIFQQYHTTAIFGFHMWPNLPSGVIATRSGAMMARSSEVTIDIQGVSAHAAKYEEGIDALEASVIILQKAYEMERTMDQTIPRLLKFGRMESGTVRNAISAHTTILGTLRTFDDETFHKMCTNLKQIASIVEKDTGCNIQLHFSTGYPPLVNDEAMVKKATSLLPNLHILESPSLLAEDFSFYLQTIPGVFFYLGTGTNIPLHSSNFDFDEAVLMKGVEAYHALLFMQ